MPLFLFFVCKESSSSNIWGDNSCVLYSALSNERDSLAEQNSEFAWLVCQCVFILLNPMWTFHAIIDTVVGSLSNKCGSLPRKELLR